jgi:hypothetical protein
MDKNSTRYFMTEMTQEEFTERFKTCPISERVYNKIKYGDNYGREMDSGSNQEAGGVA